MLTFPTHAPRPAESADGYDVIVIGSGMGAAMCARPLVLAGQRVLMVERGDWVPQDLSNWAPHGTVELTPYMPADQAYTRADGHGRWRTLRTASCVGGASVFFGGAVLRYREGDFDADPEVTGASGARWPLGYGALEPHYAEAERVLDVAGADDDPTGPWRGTPYPQGARPRSPVALRIADAGRALGLTPATLPLAINYRPGRRACTACGTCDSFACALGAKNDPAARILPDLLTRGLEIRPNTIVVRLTWAGGRITGAVCRDRLTGAWITFRAGTYVLAAGALGTAHVLLASGLERINPAGHAIGRYLMRHCPAAVYGFFPRPVEGHDEFHKQLCFFDYYWGDPTRWSPLGKLGVIQSMHPPPPALLGDVLPPPLSWIAPRFVRRMAGFVVIAEDQPRAENRLTLDRSSTDQHGLPGAVVYHTHTSRDLEARRALIRGAQRILRKAGAVATYAYPFQSFSHAVGTVRMGDDPDTAPLDPAGAFRGVSNLYVSDGSTLPTSAGVNPSLTIGANALRIGAQLAGRLTNRLTAGASDASHIGRRTHPRLSRLRVGNAHP